MFSLCNEAELSKRKFSPQRHLWCWCFWSLFLWSCCRKLSWGPSPGECVPGRGQSEMAPDARMTNDRLPWERQPEDGLRLVSCTADVFWSKSTAQWKNSARHNVAAKEASKTRHTHLLACIYMYMTSQLTTEPNCLRSVTPLLWKGICFF